MAGECSYSSRGGQLGPARRGDPHLPRMAATNRYRAVVLAGTVAVALIFMKILWLPQLWATESWATLVPLWVPNLLAARNGQGGGGGTVLQSVQEAITVSQKQDSARKAVCSMSCDSGSVREMPLGVQKVRCPPSLDPCCLSARAAVCCRTLAATAKGVHT
jgi:hypothetical protein